MENSVYAEIGLEAAVADIAVPARYPRVRGMLRLMRPRQWVKNALVFVAPLALAPDRLAHRPIPIVAAFAAFTAASSVVYILNDWLDRERDLLHPEKRHRPLASGAVGPAAAVLLAALCAVLLGSALIFLPLGARLLVGAYLVLNLAYCLGLKHQPLVDISIVAVGFVLRVAAGSLAAGVPPDADLMICVYFSCLLLSLGKRRHELSAHLQAGDAHDHRPSLRQYSVALLDSLMVVSLAATVVGYFLFVRSDMTFGHPMIALLTLPFAVFAGARYLQLVVVHDTGGEPGRDLARDRATQVNAALWLGLLVVGLSV
jgi:decaprenyl-phosphate phosphoribosyltransferase